MPIPGIEQPELLPVDEELRLRRYDEEDEFALAWYQDEETLMLVDGKFQPYDRERLKKMYHYLNERGEVYFIELTKTAGGRLGMSPFGRRTCPSWWEKRDCAAKRLAAAW